MKTPKKTPFIDLFPFSLKDLASFGLIIICTLALCFVLHYAGTNDGFASPVFVLAVLLISHFTDGYLFGLIASLVGVFCVNTIFTYPYWAFDMSITGYPLTFLTFLLVSVITSTLTTQVKEKEHFRRESEKEKFRSNLLRSVSHDIRTPLTGIAGAMQTLLDQPNLPEDERRALLTNSATDAQWLIRAVENLLSITRLGDNPANLIKTAEEVFLVPMDAILIRQVITNLLENAATHGKTTKHIEVAVSVEDTYARFSVSDDGIGISDEQKRMLFCGEMGKETFSYNDKKRNMGIGLSVCRTIIQAHGGTMCVEDSVNGGARFVFSLPLDETVMEEV